jgi:phosphopentomutase
VDNLSSGGLVIANFIDFDTLYGHRRDPAGYARSLEAFDRRLPSLLAVLRPGDLLVLTADHGCDPTWRGTDHTRECVPVLVYGPGLRTGSIGRRASYSDIGQTIARHLAIPPLAHGTRW